MAEVVQEQTAEGRGKVQEVEHSPVREGQLAAYPEQMGQHLGLFPLSTSCLLDH